jgi:hypothetical protein
MTVETNLSQRRNVFIQSLLSTISVSLLISAPFFTSLSLRNHRRGIGLTHRAGECFCVLVWKGNY